MSEWRSPASVLRGPVGPSRPQTAIRRLTRHPARQHRAVPLTHACHLPQRVESRGKAARRRTGSEGERRRRRRRLRRSGDSLRGVLLTSCCLCEVCADVWFGVPWTWPCIISERGCRSSDEHLPLVGVALALLRRAACRMCRPWENMRARTPYPACPARWLTCVVLRACHAGADRIAAQVCSWRWSPILGPILSYTS